MKIVKELRKKLGLRQTELAKLMGITPANYCNIENGRLVPKNIEQIEEKAFNELWAWSSHKINNFKKQIIEIENIQDAIKAKTPF